MAYPTNYNTPEMLANSRRMYGGLYPGASRTSGMAPQVQYDAGGLRMPNPAFYQNVPGAPPPAPPPSGYAAMGGMQPSGLAARSPVPRYDASPGMNPTPTGQYANRVAAGGLMNNQQAYQNYRDTGYMPRTTVGGNFGLPGYNPDNRLSDRQVMDYAANRNQYAPMGPGAVNSAPGGPLYRGAGTGMVAYSGGMRPGFTAAGPTGQGDVARGNAALANLGYEQNDRGGWGVPGAAPMGLGVEQALAGRPAAQAAIAQRMNDARNQRLGIYQQRQANITARNQQRLEQANPAYGLAMTGLRQQGAYQQGMLMNDQNRIAAQERIAGLEQTGLNTRATAANTVQTTIAENERKMREAQYAADVARSNNNLTAEREARAQIAQLQRETAQIAATAQRDVAQANREPQMEQVRVQREQLAQHRADSLRQQAQQAYANGDIQGGQRLEQMANAQSLTGMAQQSQGAPTGNAGGAGVDGGLMANPAQAARIPQAARPAIDAAIAATRNNPEMMVQQLRSMGLTDQQINLEMTRVFPREGVFSRRYTRSASNPNGAFFSAVDPNTGTEHPFIPYIGGLIPGMAR